MYIFRYDFNQIKDMTEDQLLFLMQGYVNHKEEENKAYKKAMNSRR